MDWIKRNLFFFIGSIVAVLLMGVAGYYIYSRYELNNKILTNLDEAYAKLGRLNSESPHPGSGPVDNIKEAKDQQQQLRAFMNKCRAQFTKIPAIPDSPKVSSQDFTTALRSTIAKLQRDGTNDSVMLPTDYSFSFTVQKPRVTFAAGSLEPLAVQLGEVSAICGVLFEAKINWLDNLRRERVSPDDASGPQTDYLDTKSVTNELAVMTPYEVTFRCFSSELAAVLAGFASSPHGLMVKTINVEQAQAAAGPGPESGPTPYTPGYVPPVPQPQYPPPGIPRAELPGAGADAAAFARRYGTRGGGEGVAGGGAGGIPLRMTPTTPAYTPQPGAAMAGTATPQTRGGLPTVLDEKQLKITLALQVVKLLPPSTTK